MSAARILYASHTGHMIGGGQKAALYFLSRVDRGEFEPVILAPEAGEFTGRVEGMGLKTTILPMPRASILSAAAAAGTVRALRRLMASERIELIHAHSPRPAVYCLLAARRRGIPTIFHARVSDSGGLADRIIGRGAARIVAVSKAAARRFASKTLVIHNGVDLDEFKPLPGPSLRGELGIPPEAFVAGIVGQLLPRKGQDQLLRLAPRILADNPGTFFIVAGEGDEAYAETLRETAEVSGISGRVRFLGVRRDVPEVMRTMDLFVLPTELEGLSRVILEAMASGLPVVATDVGGNPEAVLDGRTGFLVPYGDAEALAGAIRTLAADRELRLEMGRAGRSRAEELFDVDENVRGVLDVYREIIGAGRGE